MLWVWPVCTETAVGLRAMPIAGAVALITTCAVAFFVGCACKTAEMVTVAGEGTAAGAVYRPVESIVPWVDSPPVISLTFQITAVLEAWPTEAVNFVVPETGTEVVVGVTTI